MSANQVSSAQLESDAQELIDAYLGSEIIGSFFTREKGVMGIAANRQDGCVDVIIYGAPDSEEARTILRDAKYRIASPVRIL